MHFLVSFAGELNSVLTSDIHLEASPGGFVAAQDFKNLTLSTSIDLDDCAFAEALVGKPNDWEQKASFFAPKFLTDGPILENVSNQVSRLSSSPQQKFTGQQIAIPVPKKLLQPAPGL